VLGVSSVLAAPKPEVKEPQEYETNLLPQSSFSVEPKCGTKNRNPLSSPSLRFAKTVRPGQSLFGHTQASKDGLLDSNPSLLPTRETSLVDEAVRLASPSCSPLSRQTRTAVSQTFIGPSSEAQTDPDGKQSPFCFSTLPSSPWNVQVARSPLADFSTSEGSPLGSKSLPLRCSPLGSGKHDNSATQSASVFGALPKKSLAPDFTFSSTFRLHLDQRQAPHVSAPISGAQDDSSSNTSGSTCKRQKHVSMTSEVTLGSSNIASGKCSVASTIKKEKPSDQIGHMNILKSACSMASDLSYSANKVAKDDPAIDKALGNIKADKDSVGATKISTASLFQFGAEAFSSSFSFYTQPVATKEATASTERKQYMRLHNTEDNNMSSAHEQLRTAPLVSLSVKQRSETKDNKLSMFPQYALLGCRMSDSCSSEGEGDPMEPEPILLNTNTPWSLFICGSQGSGKSYTLSAIIENCLYTSPKIGKLPKPLAGVVFHKNTRSSHDICEAAHLVSLGIKVNVLVSRSNYHALWSIYRKAASPQAARFLDIQPIVLQSHHLTAERIHRLMAFQEAKTVVPLYMEIILRILREMAITGLPFSYAAFKTRLSQESLQPGQTTMMNMRLNLLESFLEPDCLVATGMPNTRPKMDIFSVAQGTLTIVDLSDPFLDSNTACTLFDILLSLFTSSRPEAGMLVCLDEAHKFIKSTPAAEAFTDHLLTLIREQRHNACRVVIATQEPTVSPELLDLCSITMVHRFTSANWFVTLREHLAAASDLVTTTGDGGKTRNAAAMFQKIIDLDAGESLLFAPSAVIEEVSDGKFKKLGTQHIRLKTRTRLGDDGGRSILAIR
jgi:hypothetical protein